MSGPRVDATYHVWNLPIYQGQGTLTVVFNDVLIDQPNAPR